MIWPESSFSWEKLQFFENQRFQKFSKKTKSPKLSSFQTWRRIILISLYFQRTCYIPHFMLNIFNGLFSSQGLKWPEDPKHEGPFWDSNGRTVNGRQKCSYFNPQTAYTHYNWYKFGVIFGRNRYFWIFSGKRFMLQILSKMPFTQKCNFLEQINCKLCRLGYQVYFFACGWLLVVN